MFFGRKHCLFLTANFQNVDPCFHLPHVLLNLLYFLTLITVSAFQQFFSQQAVFLLQLLVFDLHPSVVSLDFMDFFSDFGREKIDSEGLGVFNGRQKPRASGVFYRLDVLDEPGNRAVDLLEDLEEEHVEVELVLEIQFQGVAKVAVDLQDGQEPDELLPIFDDADSQ